MDPPTDYQTSPKSHPIPACQAVHATHTARETIKAFPSPILNSLMVNGPKDA